MLKPFCFPNLITFKGNSDVKKADLNRNKTITILGSSRSTEALKPYETFIYDVSSELVRKGNTILTGNGKFGIMGAAYKAAKEIEKNRNQAIIMIPPYGDEDFENCVVIDKAKSEDERIIKFDYSSKIKLINPGGAATLKEFTSFIERKYSRGKNLPSKLYLIGDKPFIGMREQIKTLEDHGYLGQTKAEDLYSPVKSLDKVALVNDILRNQDNVFAEKIDLLNKNSEKNANITKHKNNYLIFPGGLKTLKRAVSLITAAQYTKNNEKPNIFLVGKDFYAGLDKQYHDCSNMGLLGKKKPEDLYTLIDKNEIGFTDLTVPKNIYTASKINLGF